MKTLDPVGAEANIRDAEGNLDIHQRWLRNWIF